MVADSRSFVWFGASTFVTSKHSLIGSLLIGHVAPDEIADKNYEKEMMNNNTVKPPALSGNHDDFVFQVPPPRPPKNIPNLLNTVRSDSQIEDDNNPWEK